MTPNAITPAHTVEYIRSIVPDFRPKLGIILGSGLGQVAAMIQQPTVVPYEQLPGMQPCRVEGHQGQLMLGTVKRVAVACFQGRNHLYEGHPPSVIQTPVRTLKLLGAERVLIIGAVGSLTPDIPVGSFVLITDHLNFQFSNPLVGVNDESWGTRFPTLEDAYDPEWRAELLSAAQQLGIPLHSGVYVGVLGPSFETPAEIRAFRLLGADVVGMALVPEVITARHCGLRVASIGVVGNMAAGLTHTKLEHRDGVTIVQQQVHELARLLLAVIDRY